MKTIEKVQLSDDVFELFLKDCKEKKRSRRNNATIIIEDYLTKK